MTGHQVQSTAPREPAGQLPLLESARPAGEYVGAVVRYRKIVSSETGFVLGVLGDGRAEIVKGTGETVPVPIAKIKETLADPAPEVRSVPGRLLRFLNSGGADGFRTDDVVATVRGRLDELTQVRDHAIGLLLDRGPLLLSLPDCLALPIEPWRVRYEFLVGSGAGDDQTGLALSITSDPGAPTEVRALVALMFGPERVKQFLIVDSAAEESLPSEWAPSVLQLRDSLYQFGSGILRDPVVDELLAVVGSNGQEQPSEVLLADRSTWPLLLDLGLTGSGSSGPLGAEFAGVSALRRAKNALFEWKWDEARSIARDGLRASRREEVRDELLNIVACALWLKGEPEPALAALDTALDGAYTDALLINASVIATELEHDSARDRLVRLAREAPTGHQRAVAAERALVLWDNDEDRIWEDDDDETLPTEIRDALRPLISEPLPADRYLRVLRVLASRDDEWLAARAQANFGVNAADQACGNATIVRVYQARAAGIDRYVEVLAAELRKGKTADWVPQERDGIVEAATQVLFERNDELSAAFFGMTLLDANLPMKVDQGVALRCLTVASIAQNVREEGGEPQLRFIDWVEEAKKDLASLDGTDRERLSGLVEIAAGALAVSYLISRSEHLQQAEVTWNKLCLEAQQALFNPTVRLNMPKVKQGLAPIAGMCRETEQLFGRLKPFVDDYDLGQRITQLTRLASDLRRMMENPTQSQMTDTALELIRNYRSGGFGR